jgi:SAM-dependent methyltransferase
MSDSRFALRRGSREVTAPARGRLDLPATGAITRGAVHFEGWALQGNRPPARVELVFNDAARFSARLGIDRFDVPDNQQQPDAVAACGWAVTVDVGQYPPGKLRVEVVAHDDSGNQATLDHRVFDVVDDDIDVAPERILRSPTWDWELPEFLARTPSELSRQISPRERMPKDDIDVYLSVGRSALKAIRLAQIAAGKPDFVSILDMPCGHGRVLRWLKAAYPDAMFTACDLLSDGVDFCAGSLGATPVYSSPLPDAEAFPHRYDLIFVGSLLTHVDVHQWDHLISLWHRLLLPDGLLIVTTHGELVAERMRAGHLYGYAASAIKRTVRTYEHSGFAFLQDQGTESDYGITISRPDWTLSRLLRHKDFRVVMAGEALWDRHQDVTAVVKRPLIPADLENQGGW